MLVSVTGQVPVTEADPVTIRREDKLNNVWKEKLLERIPVELQVQGWDENAGKRLIIRVVVAVR